MKMSRLWWILLSAFVAFSFSVSAVNSESTAFPSIPKYLLECYVDNGIYHRANRMSSTFSSFVDLVRKIETSPTSRNMNARELSMVLLHYFKLDGILSLQQHTKHLPNNIVPFAASGEEYFKHRLTVVGLVPKVDGNYMAAVNESLTKEEMCNLHFMLSYSVEPYKREDERCSNLIEDNKWQQPEPRSDWDPYQSLHEPYRRYNRNRRNVDISNRSNRVDVGKERKEQSGKFIKKREMTEEGSEQSRIKRNDNAKADVETILPNKLSNTSTNKDKFTIGNQELLSAAEHFPKTGMQSLINTQTFGRHGGRYPARFGTSIDDRSYSGIIPNIPLSDCPAVNGIIKTSYGSLAIGSVIAGIAAGMNPEEIPPTKLSVDPTELESPGDRVNNIWGATLAGTVADTISSSALLNTDSMQVLKGGWNDTLCPKWYLLKSNQFRQLTEVAIRGSLDGLILGLNIREWTNKFPTFKLSQILQIYYEGSWGVIGARNRVQLRPKFAPDEIFRKQVLLMSLVFKKQKLNVLTVLGYNQIAKEAVAKVNQHIQSMEDTERAYLGSFPTIKTDNAINTIAVVDSSWGYENLMAIFTVLRDTQVAATPESNLTVVCGNDGRILFTAQSSTDLFRQFNKDTLFENCTRGMNIPLSFDMVEPIYRKIYNEEKMTLKMNTDSLVLLLLPYDSLLRENEDYSAERSRNFRFAFPDVRVLIGANGRAESFVPLVKNPKDVFTLHPFTADPSMKSVYTLVNGLKEVHQRLTKPSCGSYFNDQGEETEFRVIRDVMPDSVVYYRLLPQYFYTQKGQVLITIRSKQRAPLTVCHSREMDKPVGPSPRVESNPNFFNRDTPYGRDYPQENPSARQTVNDGSVHCQTITSETYRIELNNPCEGASSLEGCQPLYISLTAPLQENPSIICPNCRLAINVQYEVTASGLTCYNSASAILISPLLVALVFILLFSNNQSL